MEAGKNIVGQLRPNFGEICLGSTSIKDHEDGTNVANMQCTSTDLKRIKDGRRSFPSGHSAVAVGTAFYFELWLLKMSRSWELEGLKAQGVILGGMIPMSWGFWVACSRVFDNAHRVSDIIAGGFLGIWTAGIMFWHVLQQNELFLKRMRREELGEGKTA